LELKIPEIDFAHEGLWAILYAIKSHLFSFTLSFITLAAVWVNHYHLFHPVKATDGKMLWYNNFLLFWVCLVPFVSTYLGEHVFEPTVLAMYGFVFFMIAVAFVILVRHVFFSSHLLPSDVPMKNRQRDYKRSLLGPLVYGVGTIAALFNPWLGLIIFAVPIIFYFSPIAVTHDE
jgi:uncharacterized membrane protein